MAFISAKKVFSEFSSIPQNIWDCIIFLKHTCNNCDDQQAGEGEFNVRITVYLHTAFLFSFFMAPAM